MNKKTSFVYLILLSITINCFSQTTLGYRNSINVGKVPKVILRTFNEQYPNVHLMGWYSTHIAYWQNDYSGWYSTWYKDQSRVFFKFENPNYFEVGYINGDGNDCRSIYDIYGYWYETRTKILELPSPITNSVNNTKYESWSISPLKEKIETPRWPTIYRFHIYKEKKSRIVRMDIEGNIIQAKHINE